MGRGGGAKLPGFCLNRIRTHARVRSLPSIRSKPSETEHEGSNASYQKEADATEEKRPPSVMGRNIMIVVDSSAEAKGTLQWALTHTVQTVNGECDEETAPRAHQLLQSMKGVCLSKRPEVRVETVAVEGKEKGPTIVEEARRRGAEMLASDEMETAHDVGRERDGGVGAVECCIQIADCMAIALRRKSEKLGGYMITTKKTEGLLASRLTSSPSSSSSIPNLEFRRKEIGISEFNSITESCYHHGHVKFLIRIRMHPRRRILHV